MSLSDSPKTEGFVYEGSLDAGHIQLDRDRCTDIDRKTEMSILRQRGVGTSCRVSQRMRASSRVREPLAVISATGHLARGAAGALGGPGEPESHGGGGGGGGGGGACRGCARAAVRVTSDDLSTPHPHSAVESCDDGLDQLIRYTYRHTKHCCMRSAA